MHSKVFHQSLCFKTEKHYQRTDRDIHTEELIVGDKKKFCFFKIVYV